MNDTRTPINVEDYPEIDPETEEGKDALSSLGFLLATPDRTPIHFVFMYRGKEIGQMIVKAPFADKEH